MDWRLVGVFLVTMLASAMSGMAGGGGSFIITPFYIWLGLTPQQAVATGKFGGFGLSVGAVAAFRERMLENKRLSLAVIGLTTVISVIATFILKSINNSHLQLFIGIAMLAMVPFMIFKNKRPKRGKVTSPMKAAGLALLTLILLVQGVLSSGVGSLTSAIFMLFFGMTPLEANVMKRKTSLVITTVMPLILLTSGLINFGYGLCGIAGGLAGGYMGSRIAVKKGDEFARAALLVFMTLSGIWLITTAR